MLRRSFKQSLLPLLTLMFLSTPIAGMAQQYGDFTYTVSGNIVIITGYTGSGGAVTIPGSINGLSVAYINQTAFYGKSNITSVVIPSSVTGIIGPNPDAFAYCASLMSITVDPLNSVFSSVDGVWFNRNQTTLVEYPMGRTGSYAIPSGVIRIASWAFVACVNLTSITIPDGVKNIGNGSFDNCTSLISVTIPSSVTNLDNQAFHDCYGLTNIFFMGNTPTVGSFALGVDFPSPPKTVYYLLGTTGWGATFAGVPTALWTPTPTAPNLQGNQFGFGICGPLGISIVIEASTNPLSSSWVPLETNTFAGDCIDFRDASWASSPARFYRIRSQ